MNTNLMNTNTNRYKPKTFDLHGLEGISDNTIDLHLSLYEGYVKNTNLLSLELTKLAMKNSASASNPVYAALKRRFGFEYNGMVLHRQPDSGGEGCAVRASLENVMRKFRQPRGMAKRL